MSDSLNYNEVFHFMKKFGIDYINRYNELIIDEPTNTYVGIEQCKNIEDVETYVVFALCRPIGKGLGDRPAKRLLNRVNQYFRTNLTKDDMHTMYIHLCYLEKLNEFKDFIKRGFPMEELQSEGYEV